MLFCENLLLTLGWLPPAHEYRDRSQPSCCLSRLQAEKGVSVGPCPEEWTCVTHFGCDSGELAGVPLEISCVMQSQAGHPEGPFFPENAFMLTEFRWCQPSAQGPGGSAEVPKSLGQGRNVYGMWGSNVTFRPQEGWGRTGC